MPVYLDSDRSSSNSQGVITWAGRKMSPQRSEDSSQCVSIGLINNMAHAAFRATERQFISILDSASEGIPIRLSFYSLPGVPRPDLGGNNGVCNYQSIDTLLEANLDGLIVTGKEPITSNLKDEPCWQSFTQVLEWARDNTHSTVWSCLAAHAAVLYLDGIERRTSGDKHFGAFECARVSNHPLIAGTPTRFLVPHSRWNGLAEEELTACGYSVLARTTCAGVDTFVKQGKSLFVFFQGHLEYESETLLREYLRDVGRYLRYEAATYPSLPVSYFDCGTESVLNALRERAMLCRSEDLFAHVATALEATRVKNKWHRTATGVYRNWLEYICARKNARQLDGDAIVA